MIFHTNYVIVLKSNIGVEVLIHTIDTVNLNGQYFTSIEAHNYSKTTLIF